MTSLSAARHWLEREKIEVLAASTFLGLARDMELAGAPRALVRLAERASCDELRHADQCRALVDHLSPTALPKVERRLVPVTIGRASDDPRRRALSKAVALCAITESLSTALLIEIRERATDDLVKDTVHAILKDEVMHSRLGWAYLDFASSRGLAREIPNTSAMLQAALRHEVDELAAEDARAGALEGYGILKTSTATDICRRTIDGVILPGLKHYGVSPA